jgi:hypothetical protein
VTTYRAQVRVDDGMLHTARPLTAPDEVSDVIESLVFSMRQAAGGDVVAVDVTIETAGTSDTPVGDSVAATSSEPIPAAPPEAPADNPAQVADVAQPGTSA